MTSQHLATLPARHRPPRAESAAGCTPPRPALSPAPLPPQGLCHPPSPRTSHPRSRLFGCSSRGAFLASQRGRGVACSRPQDRPEPQALHPRPQPGQPAGTSAVCFATAP
eukprot:scaffold2804_cov371-Prasinococcus_capsulatus_cf.AAC.23